MCPPLSLLTSSACVYKTNFCALFIFKIAYMKHIMSAYSCFLSQKTSHLTRYMTLGFESFPKASWENQEIDFWMKHVVIICAMICRENMRQEKKIYIPLPQICCCIVITCTLFAFSNVSECRKHFGAYQWDNEVIGFRMNGWMFKFDTPTKLSSILVSEQICIHTQFTL
jgi:hypothetical protein